MCGIAGIININGNPVSLPALQRMIDRLQHRGPDGEGVWLSKESAIGLGHRRLSIIDLSDGGHQPMHYMGRYSITYNGEIYNYIEIRNRLSKMGYQFQSKSDTEVILAAYDAWEVACLQYFDGMFAFAIWDEKKRELFCARDRFGEKPFFYHYAKGNQFVFGSEMKSLFTYGISKELNQAMLFRYLAYDVVENPDNKSETFYKKVNRLEPGHYMKISYKGRMTKNIYWKIDEEYKDLKITFDDACEQFRHLFTASVKNRLRSDVTVGSSLSGGLDSSAVVLTIDQLRNQNDPPQNTFSARFKDDRFDEGRFMKLVVDNKKIMAHYTWPDEDRLVSELDKVYYHQEEPFGTASILAQWEVMRLAKEHDVTVLLDGQGADETLAGYLHFFDPFLRENFLKNKSAFKREQLAFEQLHKTVFRKNLHFKFEAKYPHFLRQIGKVGRSFVKPAYLKCFTDDFLQDYQDMKIPFPDESNDLNGALRYHCNQYGLEKLLRFSDRNAMAFSREVRLPFLSHDLVTFLFSLPAHFKIHNGWTKYILRSAMQPLLPEAITWRVDKLGFMPPQKSWMKNESIISRVQDSKLMLKDEHILKSFGGISDWQLLMVGNLFQKNLHTAE